MVEEKLGAAESAVAACGSTAVNDQVALQWGLGREHIAGARVHGTAVIGLTCELLSSPTVVVLVELANIYTAVCSRPRAVTSSLSTSTPQVHDAMASRLSYHGHEQTSAAFPMSDSSWSFPS